MLMENREKEEEGICIMSFDGGGPGSMSQLRILEEVMMRLAFESGVGVDNLRPSNYFDLMGGVGFGGFVALLLGRLRMTISQATEELATIGSVSFPEDNGMATPNVNMARLRKAIESMLERHGHSVDMKLRDNSDNRCKVVLFAATTTVMDHCHPFRTYRSPRKCRECTLVDAACATMATPDYFSSVTIGPRLREQSYAGIPHGFDNPMREVFKEAQLVFGDERPVSLVLSLGSGQRARLSNLDHHVTRISRIQCDGVARDLQHQLCGFGEYLRLNVDRGMEKFELNDWSNLGSIEDHTEVYLEINPITKYIDRAVRWLLKRNGSVTLAQLTGTSSDSVVKFHSETLKDYLAMEFKQMHNIVQRLGIEKITLVDAIGNHIPIPTEFCLTYTMLSDVIGVYFRHQKAPGSDFVERGDYRLVHGSRRNIVGQMEWTRINKAGLRVEMSMILRTRNEDKVRCPRCRTQFEGRATDGWAQCFACSGVFQIENKVQVEPRVQPDDQTPSEGEHPMKSSLVTPAIRRESRSSEPLTRQHTTGAEAVTLQFCLISVINLLEQSPRHMLLPQQQPRGPPQQPTPLGGHPDHPGSVGPPGTMYTMGGMPGGQQTLQYQMLTGPPSATAGYGGPLGSGPGVPVGVRRGGAMPITVNGQPQGPGTGMPMRYGQPQMGVGRAMPNGMAQTNLGRGIGMPGAVGGLPGMRMVYPPGMNPPPGTRIMTALGSMPGHPGQQYLVDVNQYGQAVSFAQSQQQYVISDGPGGPGQSSTHSIGGPPQEPTPWGGPRTYPGSSREKLYQQRQILTSRMTPGSMRALPPLQDLSTRPATPANAPTLGGSDAARGITKPPTPANAQAPLASMNAPTPGGRPGTASGPQNPASYTPRMTTAKMAGAGASVQSSPGSMQRNHSTNMGLQQQQQLQAQQTHLSQPGGPPPQSIGPIGPPDPMDPSSLFRPTPAQIEIERNMQIYGPSQNSGPMEGVRYAMMGYTPNDNDR